METTTLYRKVGKRYVKHDDYLDERGLPCGLYLFYRPNHRGEHQAMMSMIHYARVHEIQNVDRFCDLFVKYEDEIRVKLIKEMQNLKDCYSSSDLVKIMLKVMSELE